MSKEYLTNKTDFDAHVSNKSNPHAVTKAQVGLGDVDNTADSAKNVASAVKLASARTINGVAFDGTKNISIDAVTAAQLQEVKNLLSDGKTKVANAITGKGISTATNATFTTMANNINAITTLGQGTADTNVSAYDMISGKTAYARGSKITGTLPEYGAYVDTQSGSVGYSNNNFYVRFPQGAYRTNTGTGYPEVVVPQNYVASSIGLTSDKIKAGVNILGVTGNCEQAVTALTRQEFTITEITNNGRNDWYGTASRTVPRKILLVMFLGYDSSDGYIETRNIWVPNVGLINNCGRYNTVFADAQSYTIYPYSGRSFSLSADHKTITITAEGYRDICSDTIKLYLYY